MIPQNVLSSQTVKDKFLTPYGIITNSLVKCWTRGGVELQNTSQGLDYQNWFCEWNALDNTVYVTPDNTKNPIAIFTEVDVFELSIAFDQNMRYAAGTLLRDGTFKLRWYDTLVGAYVVTIFTGFTAFKLTLDDNRTVQIGAGVSDVTLTYLKTNSLYFRAQRDRYGVEYLLESEMPDGLRITNFGMNEIRRLQWRFKTRLYKERLPWLP